MYRLLVFNCAASSVRRRDGPPDPGETGRFARESVKGSDAPRHQARPASQTGPTQAVMAHHQEETWQKVTERFHQLLATALPHLLRAESGFSNELALEPGQLPVHLRQSAAARATDDAEALRNLARPPNDVQAHLEEPRSRLAKILELEPRPPEEASADGRLQEVRADAAKRVFCHFILLSALSERPVSANNHSFLELRRVLEAACSSAGYEPDGVPKALL